MNWSELAVLVTGGTGTLGHILVRAMLHDLHPSRVIVFSRNELQQLEMRTVERLDHPSITYMIGDVRDRDRLRQACRGIDVVIHAAALKQVPACEQNPGEAVATNVLGAQNLIQVALDCGVKRVLGISTDKAVDPVNIYGATKFCAERLLIHANGLTDGSEPRFSCVRYGNVLGSRGSLVPRLRQQREQGRILLTDRRMTRFMISAREALDVVLRAVETMRGGEVFVPKIPSVRIADVVDIVASGCPVQEIGRRPGERLHETLVSESEAHRTLETDRCFIIQPEHAWWRPPQDMTGRPVADGFTYRSDRNERWLSPEQIRELAEQPVCS